MPDVFVSDPKPQENPNTTSPAAVPSRSHSRFGSFSLYPEDVDFETREKTEKVILLLRQHPIVNVKWVLISILLLGIPGIIGSFGFLSSLPAGFDLIITLSWYLFTMAYALESFLSWYFNVYFVTNLRVVDVDFYNLIYKQVSDANIDKIQDVSYNMGGVARTVFNYGNVFIQTAAEVSEFDFLAVPHPDKVAKVIEDLMTTGEDEDDL